jgi:hypothetical protein
MEEKAPSSRRERFAGRDRRVVDHYGNARSLDFFVRDDASGQVGHHEGLGQSVPRAYASVQG